MKKINKCGTYQYIGKDDIVHSFIEGNLDLPYYWIDPINIVIDKFRERFFGISYGLYLRGSLAQNIYYNGISDLDFIMIVDSTGDEKLDNNHNKLGMNIYNFSHEILDNYPNIKKMNCSTFISNRLSIGAMYQLAVHSRHLDGTDIIPSLPPQKIHNALYDFANNFYENPNIDWFLMWVKYEIINWDNKIGSYDISSEDNYVRYVCRGFLRYFFMVSVMNNKKIYTRDLYPCYHFLSEMYPDLQKILLEILEGAVYQEHDANKVHINFEKVIDYFEKN